MAFAAQNHFITALLVLVSIAASFTLTPLSIRIAKKFNIIDYPGRSGHTIHKAPIPRSGGIAIFLSILMVILIFFIGGISWSLLPLIPALIVFAFGLWDDRNGMAAITKLIGQLMATAILIALGVRVRIFESSGSFTQLPAQLAAWVDIGITIFWMVGITNALNMVDSMDGLAIGLSRIISVFYLFSTNISKQSELSLLAAMLFGVSIGVAFYNEKPAKTFLGDSGAQSLGFILAAIAILYNPKGFSQQVSWFTPILFFSVPIFDTTLVTISRLRRRLPFYKANFDHIFHRLVRFEWDEYRAVSIMRLINILCCLVAVCVVYLDPLSANIIFIVWLLIFFALLIALERAYTAFSR